MSHLNKYSIWIVPKGKAGRHVQKLINTLADMYQAPRFVPHLTLVANIFADNLGLAEVKAHTQRICEHLGPFTVTLNHYNYKNEEFRCLYSRVESDDLTTVYHVAAQEFPQVRNEHFADMPHLSLLYGLFSTTQKQAMIATLPKEPTTFEVSSLDLYLTNGDNASAWRLEESFPLVV